MHTWESPIQLKENTMSSPQMLDMPFYINLTPYLNCNFNPVLTLYLIID